MEKESFEQNEQSENRCPWGCMGCEKSVEENSEWLEKEKQKEERKKEHEDSEKLDELLKELKRRGKDKKNKK